MKRAAPVAPEPQSKRSSRRITESTSLSDSTPSKTNPTGIIAPSPQTTPVKTKTANSSSSSSSIATSPLPPRLESGAFDKLPLDNVQDILSFLTVTDVVRFTMTCKLHYQPDTTPDWFWKPLLNSPQVDPLNEFTTNVPPKLAELLKNNYDARTIVETVMSDRCSVCDAPTQGFDILSCSRACAECWQCSCDNVTVRGVNSLRQPPSIVVTLDPVASVITKYPNLQHTIESPKIFTNLVDALQQCPNQCTLLVDMPCDLPKMIEKCNKAKAHGVLGGVYGRVSAGIPLTNSLVIDEDIKVIRNVGKILGSI